MDANVSDAVRIAQIAAESSQSIVELVAFSIVAVGLFWSITQL